jgi:Kef-type K+ transport system membrane component KefB
MNVSILVLQTAVVLLASRVVGRLFRLIRQPQVMGEMAAGIVLGPSLLGWLWPGVYGALFPEGSLDRLHTLSHIGLLLFLFVVGLELNVVSLRGHSRAALFTSHASIFAPFLMGAVLSRPLYPVFAPEGVPPAVFALFLGAAMSVTAFPVLARILNEQGLTKTEVGAVAIACAAVDDVTAWCILAGIVVLARSTQAAAPVWVTVGGCLAFTALMLGVVRPLLRKLVPEFHRSGRISDDRLAFILAIALVSGLITEWLGVHVLFGAFLAGAVMPKDARFTEHLTERLQPITVVLLLPLFFAFNGLRTSIGLVSGRQMWLYGCAVMAVAVAGKFGGSMLGARVSGLRWRESAALGALMNTRGLMELVILNIGLDIGVITPALFSIMVMMALATTFMTAPALHWIYPAGKYAGRQAAAANLDPAA